MIEDYYLTEQTNSPDLYSKSLEYILPQATVKLKERSDCFYSSGDGIISKGFYLGTSLTQNLNEIEIQNSHSVIVSIPISGHYNTKFSSKKRLANIPYSGSFFLPTDSILYSTDIDTIEDLFLVCDYDQLVPLLEQNFGIYRTLEHCFNFDRTNPKVQLHYEFMMNNLQLLRQYPHLRESLHFKASIGEIAKLLLTELIADSLNTGTKLNNTADSALVNRAEELIDANPEKYFSVQQIAEDVSTTPRNLQIVFKKHRDFTPMQFLKNRKLNKARLLLINPDSNTMVKSIAYESGFLNLSSFSKQYKELFGELPSETLHNSI